MKSAFSKIMLLTFCLSTLIACTDSEQQNTLVSDTPRMVKSIPLEKFDGIIERHITGRLQAADTTSLSFEVSGVVQKVHINLGQSFTKGQMLAELDPQIFKLAVEQRGSLLAEAKAARTEAKQSLDRNLALKSQKLVSQALVDNAQAAFDIANQRVNSAISALNIDKKNLADTKLYAPYNGTLSARLIEPSQQINVQTPAFTIQGEANLEVAAAIPESLISRIELGEQVQVKIPAFSTIESYNATLTEIGTQASIANAFPITITFTESNPNLRPGMSAEILLPIKEQGQAAFTLAEPDGLTWYTIPLTAIATDSEGQYVQVIEEDKDGFVVNKMYVEIVQILPNAILASLPIKEQQNYQVVTAGVEFLRAGQSVMPLNQSQLIYNQ